LSEVASVCRHELPAHGAFTLPQDALRKAHGRHRNSLRFARTVFHATSFARTGTVGFLKNSPATARDLNREISSAVRYNLPKTFTGAMSPIFRQRHPVVEEMLRPRSQSHHETMPVS
jgi:hypothetical protein